MRKEKVSNEVSKYRIAAGVTQEELALGVEVTRQTIIALEKGNYIPSVLLALKIARFFDVPVETVFSVSYE